MNIAVCGLGRAGKELAWKVSGETKHRLVMGICRENSETAGKDIGEMIGAVPLNACIYKLSECEMALIENNVDVVIDFSGKETSLQLVSICRKARKNLVVCVTNFDEKEQEHLKKMADSQEFGLVYAPNLTLGINLLMEFVAKLSRVLPEFDFEIVERHCKDKPRITTTARLISEAIGRDDVTISSVRAGGYVGIHEVTAASEEERITIEHESFSRKAFAKGALLAAEYLEGKSGFYQMKDVIDNLGKNI